MAVNANDVLNKVIAGDVVKPGFSGIGRFRGRTDYSEDEKTILNYFFTNIESNVYCATDNMPNELWALVMGQYARSNLTARDRLLKLFSDMAEKEKAMTISEFADVIKNNNNIHEQLGAYIKQAGKFIETWGVKYGHASLRDSGVIRICFEGVSQRATKFLEAPREGAYQEQSTRALPFTLENLGVPYEIQGTKYEQMMLDLDKKIIDLNQRINDAGIEFLNKKFAHLREEADKNVAEQVGDADAKLSDRDWNSIIAAKSFDISRYLLPQNITTSLGITLNTRRFQDALTEWQSSPFLEMQVLGRVAQIESMKISPTLMKYGSKSDYHAGVNDSLIKLNKKYLKPNMEYKHYDVTSKLISATPDIEDHVLASVLLNASNGGVGYDDLLTHVKGLSKEERVQIAEDMCKDKKSYEIFTKKMEIGSFVFERLYDIGAFRDLQRQRGDRQQFNSYGVVGYNMPKEVEEMGFKEEFESVMNEVKTFYDQLIDDELYSVAEYVPLMANVLRHVVTKDPVQSFYEAKLRAQPAGIDSYRLIAQEEIEQVLEKLPAFKGLVPYDDKYYDLGRLPEATRLCVDRLKRKKSK